MSDWELGKRLVEEMVFEQLIDAFVLISDRVVTEEMEGDIPTLGDPPDVVIGLDGMATGIELAEIRNCEDAWEYFEEASRLTFKKDASYKRRDVFAMPIILIFHSTHPPLFDISDELTQFRDHGEFNDVGFMEIWAVDFSDAYYSPGHPFRMPDMFCFKPMERFGFHRIGDHGRKPYG